MHDNQPPPTRDWAEFRSDLLKIAHEGDHGWLDESEVKSVLKESSRTGLRLGLLVSCRAAAGRGRTAPVLVKLAKKPRILIIDDERNNCVVLKSALEKSGFEVRAEEESTHYRQAIADFQPDLLLLDMVMPVVDGMEILQALGKDEVTRRLPVIVLTGLLADSHAAAINREGVLFLAKPLGARSLIHCISQHLARK